MILKEELWHHPQRKRRCWLGRCNTEKFASMTTLPQPGLICACSKAFFGGHSQILILGAKLWNSNE